MTAETRRWVGSGVAPGTAVAASWRVDRPLPAGCGSIDPDDVEQAFGAVAADLERLADRARAQGRRAAGDIVAVGALIARDSGLVGAARQAATHADPLRAINDAVEAYAADASSRCPTRHCASVPPTSARSGGGSSSGSRASMPASASTSRDAASY